MALPTREEREALVAAGHGWPCADWQQKLAQIEKETEPTVDAPLPDAPVTEIPVIAEPAAEEPTGILAALAKAVTAAASSKADDEAVFRKATALLNSLDPDVRAKLFRTPEGQALSDALGETAAKVQKHRPGEVVHTGGLPIKIDWSEQDMRDTYPEKTFIPSETMPVIVNGISWQLRADEEFTGPSVVFDVYQEHRQAPRRSDAWKARYFSANNPWGHPGTYTPGSGWAAGMDDGGAPVSMGGGDDTGSAA